MRPGRKLGAALVGALVAVCMCAGCALGPPSAAQLEAKLWKRGRPPVELTSGDLVAAGDELYMTIVLRRTLYVYLLSRDARGEQMILYPCRRWGQSLPLAARQPHRLPPALLGRETFWPVRTATAHEHLLVLACARPAAALENAVVADFNAPPCGAVVGREAWRWLDGLSIADLGANGAARTARRGSWRARPSGQEGWLLDFDLVGAREP